MLEKYSAKNPAYRLHPGFRFSFSSPAHVIALFFGSGALHPAPGTWGSAAAAAVFLLFEQLMTGWMLLIPGILAFFTGIWAAERTGRDLGVSDAGAIVIDEVAAVWLILALLPPGLFTAFLGFAFFRFFDIIKLPPASWVDRRMHSGFGVMLDDLLAAVWAWGALQSVNLLSGGMLF